MRKRKYKISALEWNEKHPVGTKVKYHPIIDEPEFIESATRSEAWELGHGAPIVKIVGRAGGVSLDALDVVK